MASALKIVCDRCGNDGDADVTEEWSHITVNHQTVREDGTPKVTTSKFDLCPGCSETFAHWLGITQEGN